MGLFSFCSSNPPPPSSTWLCSLSCVNWSRRARTLACTRTNACMHRIVICACFLTLWPLTNACSLTNPFKARKALRAYNFIHIKFKRHGSKLVFKLKTFKDSLKHFKCDTQKLKHGNKNRKVKPRKERRKKLPKTGSNKLSIVPRYMKGAGTLQIP